MDIEEADRTIRGEMKFLRRATAVGIAMAIVALIAVAHDTTRTVELGYHERAGAGPGGAEHVVVIVESGQTLGEIAAGDAVTQIRGRLLETMTHGDNALIARYIERSEATRGKPRAQGIAMMRNYVQRWDAERGRAPWHGWRNGTVVALFCFAAVIMIAMYATWAERRLRRKYIEAIANLPDDEAPQGA